MMVTFLLSAHFSLLCLAAQPTSKGLRGVSEAEGNTVRGSGHQDTRTAGHPGQPDHHPHQPTTRTWASGSVC